jgi:hypothetical protein
MDSLKIMKQCLDEKKILEIPENSKALQTYHNENFVEAPTSRDYTVIEEQQVSDEQHFEETPVTYQSTTPSGRARTERKIMSHPGMRPLKCYLCDCDFETTPEEHFEAQHSLVQVMRCSRCEFETEFPWYLIIKF